MFAFKQISLLVTLTSLKLDFDYDSIYVYYKDKQFEFENTFELIIDTLHELLFGNFYIVFIKKKKGYFSSVIEEKVCGSEILMNQIVSSQTKKDKFFLYPTERLFDSLYFSKYEDILTGNKPRGFIDVEFKTTNLSDEFKPDDSYSIYNSIYKLIFSPHFVSSAKAMSSIAKTIFSGNFSSHLKNLAGFFMNNQIYNTLINKDKKNFCKNEGCFVKNCVDRYDKISVQQAREGLYFANLSLASYLNSIVFNFLIKKEVNFSDIEDPNLRSALERAPFYNKENVLEYSPGSANSSGYIAFLDNDTLIISLRGTLSTSDVLADLYASYSAFLNGYSHTGIMLLSEKFYEKVLMRLLQSFPGGKIKNLYFTGHSLGGALATHLYIKAKISDIKDKYNIKAVCFSAPQTISRHIFDLVDFSDLTTYNFSDDIVPRISLGTILEYKYICISMAEKFGIFSKSPEMYEYLIKLREYLKVHDIYPKLYQPGNVYHIKSFKQNDDPMIYRFKKIDSDFFAEMLFNNDFLGDHMINHQIQAFEHIIDSSAEY